MGAFNKAPFVPSNLYSKLRTYLRGMGCMVAVLGVGARAGGGRGLGFRVSACGGGSLPGCAQLVVGLQQTERSPAGQAEPTRR